jgi:signal transduction histidine kinase
MRDLAKAKILIVDDQPANVRVLERMLADNGFTEVASTTDPQVAVPLFQAGEPDLVLLDLHMPGLDGFEVMRQLRALIGDGAYLPILVLTADANSEVKKEALAGGATDFLMKPFDMTEVLLRIRNLLETRLLYVEVQSHNLQLETEVASRTRELRESLNTLRVLDEERRNLLGHLVQAQEEERARIAGDIHDDSIQVMTAVGLRLSLIRGATGNEEHRLALDKLEELVRRAIDRLRNLLFDLHPPVLDADGLAPALRMSLERIAEETGAEYSVVDRLASEPSPAARLILYRIAQEAFANARKHAEAGRLEVELESSDGGYLVRVRDDGRGFSPDDLPRARPGHLGFTAMRERAEMAAGWWRVKSSPNAGTTVEFWVPDGRRDSIAG